MGSCSIPILPRQKSFTGGKYDQALSLSIGKPWKIFLSCLPDPLSLFSPQYCSLSCSFKLFYSQCSFLDPNGGPCSVAPCIVMQLHFTQTREEKVTPFTAVNFIIIMGVVCVSIFFLFFSFFLHFHTSVVIQPRKQTVTLVPHSA